MVVELSKSYANLFLKNSDSPDKLFLNKFTLEQVLREHIRLEQIFCE